MASVKKAAHKTGRKGSGNPYQEGLQALSEHQWAHAQNLFLAAIEQEYCQKNFLPEAYNALGVAYQKQNLVEKAVEAFQHAITLKENYGNAFYNLGMLYQTRGDYAQALPALKQAVQCTPTEAKFACSLADTYRLMGQADTAGKLYFQVLAMAPDTESAFYGLALIFSDREAFSQALYYFGEAYRLNPRRLVTQNNLAWLLQKLNRVPEAIQVLEYALTVYPKQSVLWRNLGDAYQKTGKPEQAREAFEQAVAVEPDDHENHYQLGNFWYEQRNIEEARVCFEKALACNPQSADAHNMLGVVLLRQGEITESMRQIEAAIQLNPSDPIYYLNLGLRYRYSGQYEKALELFDQAVTLRPTYAEAHFAKGLDYLRLGNWEIGWQEYEWRIKAKGFSGIVDVSVPRWQGEDLNGKTIFVHAEQGYGDAMQFVRYLPLLKERGAQVVFCCDPTLKNLLAQTPGIDTFVTRKEKLPRADYHIHLLSLPGVLGTREENIPQGIPYIHVDAEKMAEWQERLPQNNRPRVGFVWQGRPTYASDHNRSCPLSKFEPLFAAFQDKVDFISLQYGPATQDLEPFQEQYGLHSFVDDVHDFVDTAAIMQHLDLIISTDTSVVHLAGAMARPVWVLLAFDPDWRWLTHRNDSPWYPGHMRLFRQPEPGAWEDVFKQVIETLPGFLD